MENGENEHKNFPRCGDLSPEGKDAGRELPRKHSCPDCRFCQICSDARCSSCRKERESQTICSKKMSFSEQIRLYNEINAKDPLLGKKHK